MTLNNEHDVNSKSEKDSSPKPLLGSWDVAIIGGGLAGATAAYHCATRGLETVLFEKASGPHHKVCGEFISGEGLPLLAEMGLDLKALGAVPIHSFRFHGPRRSFTGKLPLPAMGLSRYVLDQAMLENAARAGAEIRSGLQVREKLEGLKDPSGSILLDVGASLAEAQRLVIATGKFDFRGEDKRVGRDEGLIGFKMHLRLKPSMVRELEGHCDLFVFEGGYGGLAPIENGLANFCFLIEKAAVREIGADWNSLGSFIAKHNWEASRYLDGAEPQFKNFVTVANIPYGFVRGEKVEAGVFNVGDQIAVIPSLTGDGMSIALNTGRAAANAIVDQQRPGRVRPATLSIVYQREMRHRLQKQVDAGFYLHRLFKSPSMCDLATYAVGAFPPILDFLFHSTRYKEPKKPLAKLSAKARHLINRNSGGLTLGS